MPPTPAFSTKTNKPTQLQTATPLNTKIHCTLLITLQNEVVRAKLTPSDEEFVDIITMLDSISPVQHIEAANLPKIHPNTTNISLWYHPCCSTCSAHLLYQPTFQSTRTHKSYRIRHSFTCQSKNLIYLMCTKCQKQHVWSTTQQLNVRNNHHHQTFSQKDLHM